MIHFLFFPKSLFSNPIFVLRQSFYIYQIKAVSIELIDTQTIVLFDQLEHTVERSPVLSLLPF